MAAVVGHTNFWNLSSGEALNQVWLRVGSAKTISATVSVVAMLMSPIIVLGNSLVILSVWKDPLKTLRSSPSNFILLSMAVADLLVGLVACPLTLYWHWAMSYPEHQSFLPLLVGSLLVNVSIGHMLLLTIDRFFALVTPLHYKLHSTKRRVSIATVTCWIYFLLFGCGFGLLHKYHRAILASIHNLQIFSIIVCISVIYFVMLCRFHRYSKTTELDQSTARRQMISQRERNLCKAIAVVICVFLLCFFPWFISLIVTFFCVPCHRNVWFVLLSLALSMILTFANSGINPFLYAWRLPKYRQTFKHFFKKRACCCKNQNRQRTESHAYDDTRL